MGEESGPGISIGIFQSIEAGVIRKGIEDIKRSNCLGQGSVIRLRGHCDSEDNNTSGLLKQWTASNSKHLVLLFIF